MGVMNLQGEHWFPFEHDGRRYLLPRDCPHRGGRLDLGYLDNAKGYVVCPLHKSTFCIPSGRCRNGPAEGGIKVDIDRT